MVFMLTAGFLQAQEKLTLTLLEAKQYALRHNKTLHGSELAIDKSEQQLREAISAGLPKVTATADYSNAMGAKMSIQFDDSMPPTEIKIKPSSNLNVQLTQLIFNGNYLVGLQLAKLGKELTSKSHEKSEEDVIAQVTDAYYLVLMTGEMKELLGKNMLNLRDIYVKTEALGRVGIIEMTDVDQLAVQISMLQNTIKSTERQWELAKNMLRLQLGASANMEIDLIETLDGILMTQNVLNSLKAGFQVRNNLDFQLMEFHEKMAERQIKMQQASYLPTLVGYYSRIEKILKPAFDMSPKNMIGLNLSIPIFTGLGTQSKVKQAKIDLETMRINKALLEDRLAIQEKQLQYNLANARETYLNQVANLEVSRRVYNNLKLKFEHGMLSGLDLITADNNYVKAETDYLAAIYQLLSAQTELDKLFGQLK
ncbi:MAG: TolC family protein [Prolixibacteraceae bacterium]|nr:TolC family protein [Prolixibacteraceae bacterium]